MKIYFRCMTNITEKTIETCPKCGENFLCYETEQTPGCRNMETKTCPYCGRVLDKSMEYEWSTHKL